MSKKSLGFGADVKKRDDRRLGEMLQEIQPEDLLKFGLIPEFIGRLPVIATLTELDEASLIRILVEPKNALVKQYRRLLEMDGVSLKFSDASLQAVAKEALKRKAGARGLRAILEHAMLDIMYDLPSKKGIKEVVISEEVISKREPPLLVYEKTAESA
jgi:ATP-dependent Clp protease ATP-binding subunit ClpX